MSTNPPDPIEAELDGNRILELLWLEITGFWEGKGEIPEKALTLSEAKQALHHLIDRANQKGKLEGKIEGLTTARKFKGDLFAVTRKIDKRVKFYEVILNKSLEAKDKS